MRKIMWGSPSGGLDGAPTAAVIRSEGGPVVVVAIGQLSGAFLLASA